MNMADAVFTVEVYTEPTPFPAHSFMATSEPSAEFLALEKVAQFGGKAFVIIRTKRHRDGREVFLNPNGYSISAIDWSIMI